VKIGQQWRFPIHEVERLTGIRAPEDIVPETPGGDTSFPTHCVQTIQDLFADVSQLSAVTVDMQGNPLTEISHPTRFCQLIMSSPTGVNACRASWQSFAHDSQAVSDENGKIVAGTRFFTCQAGLQYVGAPIFDKEDQIGLFLVGQFYWNATEPREEAERIRRLSAAYRLPMEGLQSAVREVPVIEPALHSRVEGWPFSAARAIQSILRERIGFMDRLQQIATLTQVPRRIVRINGV
jgi:ligand-binding sensor protein